jgi:hypothetical protein
LRERPEKETMKNGCASDMGNWMEDDDDRSEGDCQCKSLMNKRLKKEGLHGLIKRKHR